MKYWKLWILCLMLTETISSQTIDQALMDKDLEVAENILGTLFKQSAGHPFYYIGQVKQVDGKHLPNYGVVFTVSANQFRVMSYAPKDKKKEDDVEVRIEDLDEKEPSSTLIGTFKDFLVDYGHMIRQLNPADKILVKTETRGKSRGVAVITGTKKVTVNNGISAEVSKADLVAYEKGEITRDGLLERIKVNENLTDHSKEPQLEVFSSMLERLYEVDLSDTYYMASAPDYDRMENFGVTYYLKFYSSTVYDDDNYSLPTIGRKNVGKAERNKIVEEMYPDFLKGFKQNILDYGHILKNLKEEEMLVFHMKLTSCEGCDMPAVIDVSIKKLIIEEYRSGRLSLEKALDQFEVKNLEN
jgi:hypothetical protein